ncbi:uncharacterized protein [Coffea arabica]|uniref:Uncharacterized protein isoform X1 n=1 Tax=Coffea arabica TaxID=13443 RepID=A0ABM4VL28_COFAR
MGRLCTWLHKKRSPGLHAVINVSVSKSCELVYHFSIIRNQWCIFVPVSSIFVDFLKRHWLKELLLSMATGSLSCLTPECCRADLFRHSSRIRKDACTVKNTCAFKSHGDMMPCCNGEIVGSMRYDNLPLLVSLKLMMELPLKLNIQPSFSSLRLQKLNLGQHSELWQLQCRTCKAIIWQ